MKTAETKKYVIANKNTMPPVPFSLLITAGPKSQNMTITERDACHTSFDDHMQGWGVKETTGVAISWSAWIHKRKVIKKKVIMFSSIYVKMPEDKITATPVCFLQATSRRLLDKLFSFCFVSPVYGLDTHSSSQKSKICKSNLFHSNYSFIDW